ncbi:MAG: hypothetical protein H6835_20500 [Planctomycetes bacterium]|nr:hypothetical protein [Planctomycetota bacterium]MCB9879979.1 hypothetical protein [Planctomycetota bacterium]MCB9884752.1 hypothetical protein [Planctomycetota bacterium]
MNKNLRNVTLLGLLAASSSLGGCATIAGTAVSPITGGVDLCVVSLRPSEWYYTPFVFLGGAIAGPFVAFYNGINYDPIIFTDKSDKYWEGFPAVFKPWRMVL